MGNQYKPPQVEKRNNTVAHQVDQDKDNDNTIGVSSKSFIRTPEAIYQENISTFTKFLKGEVYGGSLEERQKFQLDFFKSIPAILRLDQHKVKAILDFFVIEIAKNRETYEYSKVLAPLFKLESKLPGEDVARYKRFMLFITMLSDNARNRDRFRAQFDTVSFANMWDAVAKANITNYVFR